MIKRIILFSLLAAGLTGGIIIAADHRDAPLTTGAGGTTTGDDIADVYVFQSPSNSSNMVFVMTIQGLMSPAVSASATFPSNVLYEFNIDNTGDNIEDLVIQSYVDGGKLKVYGPVVPAVTGTTSQLMTGGAFTETVLTPYGVAGVDIGTNANGTKVFAGPRDDPFFFDLTRFQEIIAGTQTSFRNPGVDAFAGTNVLAIVVEVPKAY